MGQKVAIVQSAYIPWKGLFDMINRVDTFVFLDSVQFTKRSWINRNRIKSPLGTRWLTVPVNGSTSMQINQVKISDKHWHKSHLASLRQSYSKSPFWDEVETILSEAFREEVTLISELNQILIKSISEFLGIETTFIDSSEIPHEGNKSERLISILQYLDADSYLSGPAAKSYIGNEFNEEGINLEWMEYSNYPEYEQPHGDFRHDVTILDLIASCGNSSPSLIW